jgi:hypothetical protein
LARTAYRRASVRRTSSLILLVFATCRSGDGLPSERATRRSTETGVVAALDSDAVSAIVGATGSIDADFGAPARTDDGEAATSWFTTLNVRLEFANEEASLCDFVVEGGLAPDRVAPATFPAGETVHSRFRIVPCEALAVRSRETSMPLRLFAPGHHAMRIVVEAWRPSPWKYVTPPGAAALEGSFASRWLPFEVDGSGRPINRDDAEALLTTVEESRAGSVLGDFARRGVLTTERCLKAVANAEGFRRGRLAEAFVKECSCGHVAALERLAPLFPPASESGLDWTSHDAPPCFLRLARGQVVPVRSSNACIVFLDEVGARMELASAVEGSVDPADRSEFLGAPKDTRRTSCRKGLYRARCHVHPRSILGWILVE